MRRRVSRLSSAIRGGCAAAALLLGWGQAHALELSGVVQWSQRVELGTPGSGVVAEAPVSAGDKVKKGQLLLQLEARALQARVKRAEAEQGKWRKMRDEAQRELERSNELYARTLLSNHDLEQTKIAHADAHSRYQAATAATVEARLDLEQSALRAPFDGVVLQRNVEVGQAVVSTLQSQPLVVMAATQKMQVRTEVALAQLEKLARGQQVTVESGGKRYKGVITLIGLEPLSASGEPRYLLLVQFATEGALLRVGQPAKVITP